MQKEYNFSKGERGKFYNDVKFKIPIYLEDDISEVIQKYSEKSGKEMETIVNDWLRNDIAVIKTVIS